MVENEGQPNENVIFTSRIMVGSTGPWSPGFYLQGNYPSMSGILFDNTAFTTTFNFVNNMSIRFRIDTTNPTKAHWKLKNRMEFKIDGYNGELIPKDLIMTKQ
jgi:hypothetical protein